MNIVQTVQKALLSFSDDVNQFWKIFSSNHDLLNFRIYAFFTAPLPDSIVALLSNYLSFTFFTLSYFLIFLFRLFIFLLTACPGLHNGYVWFWRANIHRYL